MNKTLIAAILAGLPMLALAEDIKPTDTIEDKAVVTESPEKETRNNYVGARFTRNNFSWHTETIDNSDYYLSQSPKSIGGGLFIGHRFTENVRLDLEIDYTAITNKMPRVDENDRLSTTVAMANFHYNWGTKVMPYIGFGIGLAHQNMEFEFPQRNMKYGGSATNFAWQITTGFDVILTDKYNLDFGFRSRYLGEIENANVFGKDYSTSIYTFQFYAGVAYKW